jgi:hypothetical protein
MQTHEQIELKKAMRQSFDNVQELPKDERIKKAATDGANYCKAKGLNVRSVIGIIDDDGNIAQVTGDRALSYIMAGLAVELFDDDVRNRMQPSVTSTLGRVLS